MTPVQVVVAMPMQKRLRIPLDSINKIIYSICHMGQVYTFNDIMKMIGTILGHTACTVVGGNTVPLDIMSPIIESSESLEDIKYDNYMVQGQ